MGQLEDMSVFIRIVEAGGIGKAAEQLSLAKSAVSRRLVDLETRLNTKLLIRTTRKSSLTDAGRTYYQRALTILDDVSALNSQTSDSNTTLDGTLRIALPHSFGLMHLSAIIDQFIQAHPKLNLHIDFSDRKVDLVEEGYELAIRIGELKDSSLQAKKLTPIRHILCASPDYIKTQGEPHNIIELKKQHFLQYGISGQQSILIIDPQKKRHQVELSAKIAANNGIFLKEMAIAGHGIVYLPSFIVWKSLASNQLVPILSDHQLLTTGMHAVYPHTRYLSLRARLFIDFLADKFAQQPYWDGNG